MSLQVIRREEHKNFSRIVEFQITSRQLPSLDRIMALAGIDRRTDSPWGWDVDTHEGVCIVAQPWMYRGRIDHALRMFSEKWHPGFRTADQLKQGALP